jgi:hypothetical protein
MTGRARQPSCCHCVKNYVADLWCFTAAAPAALPAALSDLESRHLSFTASVASLRSRREQRCAMHCVTVLCCAVVLCCAAVCAGKALTPGELLTALEGAPLDTIYLDAAGQEKGEGGGMWGRGRGGGRGRGRGRGV